MDHEEEFLNIFFTQITQLCFDKAKELVEKERESCKSTQMGPWGMLLMHLPQIAVAERSYADLGFLHTKNKGFLRKDNSLKTMYESLKADLKRVEEMTRGTNSIGATVAEISSQLCQFINARTQLIDFYEKMYNMSINNKVMRHQELLLSIEGLIECHLHSCSHISLNTIKTAIMLECEILSHLIRAYIEIQNWKFLPSLMALYGVQTRMSAWERTLQNRETWKLGFGATFLKANQQPALYQWLIKLKSAILAKFSLYFHVTLSQQASSGEMRSIMSKQAIDYYHKGMQDYGPGYQHPKRDCDNPDDFSIILSIPQNFSQKPFTHWDIMKKNIKERYADLIVMDKIIFSRDSNNFRIYAMHNLDPRVTFVVVYETCSKQKDKDAHVVTFITDVCLQMRCNKIFESLKLTK
ncbi:KICSTOR subunit 2-like isoform X2 [Phymastichus coffea]|uniref:KICSTOR subunit 2-like isoform X2 n=1 Tax=Phymastichus coffea TaxID=108790 RepID=UPI00273B9832|nr:KICSTOR subunit 2-like isoform X2 [Phymastichus coffea]